MEDMWRLFCVAASLGALLAVGCSEQTRQFRLVRVVPPIESSLEEPCSAPVDGRIVRVNAVGEFAPINITELIEVETGAVELARFPETVRALEVVVLGEGGLERSIGRSETFDATELQDGDEVTVFMAPRHGFCRTGPPLRRTEPLVARAGLKVLVAGGWDEGGEPVTDAELYDPRTGVFSVLGDITYEPSGSNVGMAGASITSMPDGRVVIAGGPAPAYTVFDPDTETAAVPALLLSDAPAFHAAVALDDSRILLAGGCAVAQVDPDTRRCEMGLANVDAMILDIDTGQVDTLPNLARTRIGGSGFLEGDGRVILVGGVDLIGDPMTEAERIDPTSRFEREIIAGVAGVGAPLAGGGVIAAYGPVGSTSADFGSAVAPAGQATPILTVQSRDAPTITPLEGGRLLVLGGDPRVDGTGVQEAQLYVPVDGRFEGLELAPAPQRKRHGAVRLDDGSVLIVGGETLSGAALADAWIYRPDLIGPFTPIVEVTFEGDLSRHLVPRDLSRVTLTPAVDGDPARYIIESSGTAGGVPSQWGIVAGPQLSEPKLTVNISADGGSPGIALILSFVDESNFQFVTLRSGQSAELLDLVTGLPVVQGCAGTIIAADQVRGGPHTIVADVVGDELSVSVDGVEVLGCQPRSPLRQGAVGVGIVGAEFDTVTVDRVSISR